MNDEERAEGARLLAASTASPWSSHVTAASSILGWAGYRVERADGDGGMEDWVGDLNYSRNADLVVWLVNHAAELLEDSAELATLKDAG